MFKIANLKKLTAMSLIAIMAALFSTSQTAIANNGNGGGSNSTSDSSCEDRNNGGGNNPTYTVYLDYRNTITLDNYDPSNDTKKAQLIAILTTANINSEITDLAANGINVSYSNGTFPLTTEQAEYVANYDRCNDNNNPDPPVAEACTATPVTFDDGSSASGPTMLLIGTARDFQASHPDFEFNLDDGDGGNKWVSVTMEYDTGIVADTIGSDRKPVYAKNFPVGIIGSTSGANNFNQWYNDIDGVNQSTAVPITLSDPDEDGVYEYSNNNFFPLNGQLFGKIADDPSIVAPTSGWMKTEWDDNGKCSNNYHFTYEIHQPFTYRGEDETFTFEGDDDVWVYINGKRVVDIGGVHGSQTGTVTLDAAKAEELGLTVGQTYMLDFFFAERNFSGSNFTISTSLEFEDYYAD